MHFNPNPILVNAARKPTRHTYVRTERQIGVRGTLKAGKPVDIIGDALIFRCDETGVERIFGFERPAGEPDETDDESEDPHPAGPVVQGDYASHTEERR